MINLLPNQVRSETGYAKRNQTLVRYAIIIVAVIIVVAAEFIAAQMYINNKRQTLAKSIAAKNQQIATDKKLEGQAAAANAKLKAFKTLVGSQARFSNLLTDLAAHTPKGVFINSISLTNAANQAVQISATANSYESAASLRDALASSSKVQQAAINTIASTGSNSYSVSLIVAFKPGAFQ